ncbi:MAG: hypothetical protein ABF443_13470, partial [Acetobacter malorum]|uniref:hypothetical protein n=1 Tax=Acetobacter malorum TaxID=178901 RepID=UPI0039EC6E0D
GRRFKSCPRNQNPIKLNQNLARRSYARGDLCLEISQSIRSDAVVKIIHSKAGSEWARSSKIKVRTSVSPRFMPDGSIVSDLSEQRPSALAVSSRSSEQLKTHVLAPSKRQCRKVRDNGRHQDVSLKEQGYIPNHIRLPFFANFHHRKDRSKSFIFWSESNKLTKYEVLTCIKIDVSKN